MFENMEERNCEECIFHAKGSCSKWDCEFISVKEAEEAYKKLHSTEVLK